jgi:predicted patatin/cPLA2 family phospholipase
MAHPVVALLGERASRGSSDDGATLALVLEGGGMRGVVSCAMAAELERRGLTRCFDHVVGTSAGALNGAAFVAGVARGCTDNYLDEHAVRRYIAPRRLLLGRPAVDVAFTLQQVTDGLDAERHRRAVESPVPLHCLATDVETAQATRLAGFRSVAELHDALLATSRLPWVGGHAVPFRGRRYLDGGLVAPIGLDAALGLGATHVLVLQTRPEGVARTPEKRPVEWMIERRLRAQNPALVRCSRARVAVYEQVVERIAAATTEPGGAGPHVFGVRLPAGTPPVGQLERDPEVLRAAAEAAQARMGEVLDGG